jgi:hypothetical protein
MNKLILRPNFKQIIRASINFIDHDEGVALNKALQGVKEEEEIGESDSCDTFILENIYY